MLFLAAVGAPHRAQRLLLAVGEDGALTWPVRCRG
jgi:hypothetical protein